MLTLLHLLRPWPCHLSSDIVHDFGNYFYLFTVPPIVFSFYLFFHNSSILFEVFRSQNPLFICHLTTRLSLSHFVPSRLKKIFPILSFIKPERPAYTKDSVEEVRRRHLVFVGVCYTMIVYPHRHTVILKMFLSYTRLPGVWHHITGDHILFICLRRKTTTCTPFHLFHYWRQSFPNSLYKNSYREIDGIFPTHLLPTRT